MKEVFKIIFIVLAGISLQFCSDESIDQTLPPPAVSFAFDTLDVDLNKVDNPPVVAFIKSDIGLAVVNLKVETNDSIIPLSSVSEFFDSKAFSLSERITYEVNHKNIIIEAIDIAGKMTTEELPMKVVGVMSPPAIEFSVDAIIYDELIGGDIPLTEYIITSEAGITKVEMFFATEEGQLPYMAPVELEEPSSLYEFSQQIEYTPNMSGLIVKATDTYGQIGISLLPYSFIAMPAPEITLLSNDTIYSDNSTNITVRANVESIRGIQTIEVVRYQNSGNGLSEETIDLDIVNGAVEEKEVNIEVPINEATSSISIRATNQAGKEDVVTIKTFVNIRVLSQVKFGSFRYDTGLMRYYPNFITDATLPNYEPYLDVYALLSLNDAKTYSMDYYIAAKENTANVDIKLNVYWDSNNPWYQLSGIATGVDENANFFPTIANLDASQKVVVDTRFRLLDANFDFDNATASSLSSIDPSTVNDKSLRYYDKGTVIAFKTGSESSVGGETIGVMKEVDRIPISVQGYGSYTHQFTISILEIKILNP